MRRLLCLKAMANHALASTSRHMQLSGSCAQQVQGVTSCMSHHSRWRPPSLTQLSAQQACRQPTLGAKLMSTRRPVLAKSAPALVVGPQEMIEDKELHMEASESYLSYAMSVIVGRALPDVRDGLKPVHRRILYAMHDLGLVPNKPHRKCARVVGEVLGKYHPHGDSSVYDALVRLAQDFSMRLPLVAGHGNFGSLDDDPPAAMRYTECRLAPASAELLLADLDLDTVDFAPTFDAAQDEPLVLPAKIPQLLVNGAQGIAVGIATKIPPHNVSEVVAALKALIKNPHITTEELMQHMPAPDFPTGGEILQGPGILEAYETGHGSVIMRGKITIEDAESSASSATGKKKRASRKRSTSPVASDAESIPASAVGSMDGADGVGTAAGGSGRTLIVVTEMPYQLNKAELVEKIAALVEARTIEGVVDVRDESDRDGTRMVVEVKRGFSATVVLNQLLKHTRLQQSFGCNMVALVDGVPRALPLKAFLQHFLDFRCDVVERRARHRLARAQQRLHLVDGFLAAMAQLDDVVQAIRSAQDGSGAKATLCAAPFNLSEEQADGVLSLTLRRLTALEAGKLQDEGQQLRASIGELQQLLGSRELVLAEVGREAQEAAKRHGGPRRSALVAPAEDGSAVSAATVKEEDLVPNHPSLLIFSKRGFIKRLRSNTWETQRRGGKGKQGGLRDNDALEEVTACMAHDQVLFLSRSGRAHIIRAHKVPEAARTSKGTAIAQVLGLDPEDSVTAMIPLPHDGPATTTSSTSSSNGSIPSAVPVEQEHFIVMATSRGSVKRLSLSSIMATAQRKTGTRAITLQPGDELVAAGMVEDGGSVLLASSGGRVNHFMADKITATSKTASTVKGMKLKEGERLVSMVQLSPQLVAATEEWRAKESGASPTEAADAAADAAPDDDAELNSIERIGGPWLLLMSCKGRGKRVPVALFDIKSRGVQGIIGMKLADGDALSTVHLVGTGDEMVCASRQGLMSRLRTDDARVMSRATKGVKLMDLNDGDEVWTVARMAGSSDHVTQEQGN